MNYYEAHITLLGNDDQIKHFVETYGWTFSMIDGDPVEGEGVKCYATKHFNARHSQEQVLAIVQRLSNLLHDLGQSQLNPITAFAVTRTKLELVIYDSSSSKVRINDPLHLKGN